MEGHVDSSEWHGGHATLKLNWLRLGFGSAGALVECIEYAGADILERLGTLEDSLEVRLMVLDFADQRGEGVEGSKLECISRDFVSSPNNRLTSPAQTY